MKILIIGASGYLGARISQYLSEKNHQVTALARRLPEGSEGWQSGMHQVILADIKDSKTIEKITRESFDTCIYTVSLNHHDCENSIEESLRVNVEATWKILEALTQNGLKKFIYLSTQQVYGPFSPTTDYSEGAASPHNIYGLTHLLCEQIGDFCKKRHGVQTAHLRLSNAFGAPAFKNKQFEKLVLPIFCRQALEDGEIAMSSDGSPQRNWLGVGDLCRGVETLMLADKLKYSTYNIGSEKTLSLLEMAEKIAKVCNEQYGLKVTISAQESEKRFQKENERFIYPFPRLKELGYQPESDIEKEIKETLNYFRS